MTAKFEVGSSVEPIIVITRMFDADRDLVWLAITDPMHVAQWYGGPGFTSPVCEMDLRPGGAWHHVMQAPDGTQYTINSVFEEVVAPERLVWRTLKDPNRPAGPPGNHVTVTLAVHGEQTEWKMVARFKTLADRDLTAKMGFTQMIDMGLDRMATHLRSL
jgi:uncharacterized protein YndB with AHSA1/START domain